MLLRDYFNSLNFYKNDELSRNQIASSGVQVKKENQKFTAVRSRFPQNLKCGHFTLLFCRGRQRNVPKCETQMQSDCFCSLNLLFCGVVVAVATENTTENIKFVSQLIWYRLVWGRKLVWATPKNWIPVPFRHVYAVLQKLLMITAIIL